MCDICRQSPCSSRCPNAPDPSAEYICDGCGYGIYDGETYVQFGEERYCEECVSNARKFAGW